MGDGQRIRAKNKSGQVGTAIRDNSGRAVPGSFIPDPEAPQSNLGLLSKETLAQYPSALDAEVKDFYRDIPNVASTFNRYATSGITDLIPGQPNEYAKTLPGKALQGGAAATGFALGLPQKAGTYAAEKVASFVPTVFKKSLMAKGVGRITEGAVAGGVSGALTPGSLQERKQAAIFGAGGGGLLGAINAGVRAGGKAGEFIKSKFLSREENIQGVLTAPQKLTTELKEITSKGSEEIQRRLPEWYKRRNRVYGKLLERNSSGYEPTKLDVANSAKKVATDLNLIGPNARPPVDASESNLLKLIDDYSSANPDDTIKVGDLIQLKSSRFDPSSRADNMLTQELGTLIEKAVPSIKEINSRFAPLFQAGKKAGTTFQVGKGPFNTKRGSNFLAQRNPERGESKFLDVIKKQREFRGVFPAIEGKMSEIAGAEEAKRGFMRRRELLDAGIKAGTATGLVTGPLAAAYGIYKATKK